MIGRGLRHLGRAAGAGLFAVLLFAAPAMAQSAGDLFSGFQAKSKDPVQVDAETLEIFEEGKQRVSVFSGGVTVKRGPTIMKASTIRLYSDLAAKDIDSDAFTRIEASGTVYVNSGDQTATGSKAVVEMKTQLITLTGNVVLSQGSSVMTGDKLVVNLKSGRATLEQAPGKRIQGVFSQKDMKVMAPKDPPANP